MSVSSREQAITTAGEAFLDALERLESREPRAAARAAWVPGGPSVDELEALIRAHRSHPLGRAS